MKPSTRKRLTRLIFWSRLKTALMLVGALAIVVAVYAYFYWPDPVVAQRTLDGIVNSWTRPQTEQGGGRAVITVTLETGQSVVVTATSSKAPTVGQHIKVVEKEYASGHVRHFWTE